MDVNIEKYNEVYIKIQCEPYITQEISDHFTFKVPGYFFMPAYKNKVWDGNLRLYNTRTKLIYYGLLHYIIAFCKTKNFSYKVAPELYNYNDFTLEDGERFISSLNLPFKPRDYQLQSFVETVRRKRLLILSPTGSGKSLIIYLIARFLQAQGKRGLLVVPTVSLVAQMYKDFEDYGYDSFNNCHMVSAGIDKDTDKFLTISTWQSIYNQDKKYFKKFDFAIGDEAHLFKAKSLVSILEASENAEYRIGTTGTLDGTNTHRLVLEGIFGRVHKATTTSDLIENKQLSTLSIKCIVLKHSNEVCKDNRKNDYQKELDFLVKNQSRNKFVRNLALSLKGNTLILFQFVDKHGKELYRMIQEKVGPDRKVFFVSGDVDISIREDIRSIVENETDAIIVASYGTFSTGVNIKNLQNIITASPTKSMIRILQSIGRVLRLDGGDNMAILYDIADDLRIGTYTNHTLNHFVERIKIYDGEKFPYKMFKIDLL